MTTEIRIYVADLAAYCSGVLHGVWIDATQALETIQEQIQGMLKQSPVTDAEEIAIHDYEGFGECRLNEYTALSTVTAIASFIADFPDFGSGLLCHLDDLDAARKTAEEDYCGSFGSLADYAQELTEETTTIPESLRNYIDYESMARDMELGGDVFTIEADTGRVHVFWNR
jgi:antirestriction protein